MSSCSELVGKRIRVQSGAQFVVGTLQKVECPLVTVRKDDGTVMEVTCIGRPIEEAGPVSPDSFWEGVVGS